MVLRLNSMGKYSIFGHSCLIELLYIDNITIFQVTSYELPGLTNSPRKVLAKFSKETIVVP